MTTHISTLIARLDLLKADGKAHVVHLIEVDQGAVYWRFDCLHAAADEAWAYREQDGTISPSWRPGECWLESWWDAEGAELLDLNGDLLTFPLPVKPCADWDYDNGGVMVVDR